ncbi:MAG: hypothetical protein ACXVBE_07205 [Bdellovibrionota bacterium]
MKNLFLASLILFSYSQSSMAASPSTDFVVRPICPSAPAAQPLILPVGDRAIIEKRIRAELLKETGFPVLREYSVAWNSADCSAVRSEMEPELQMGACVLTARASQVYAKIALVKKQKGYDVSVIFADVE